MLSLGLLLAVGCQDPEVQRVEARAIVAEPRTAASKVEKVELGFQRAHHVTARVDASGAVRVECVEGRDAAERLVNLPLAGED